MITRPHEIGLVSSWRADSQCLVWLDPGITPCVKTPDARIGARKSQRKWGFRDFSSCADFRNAWFLGNLLAKSTPKKVAREFSYDQARSGRSSIGAHRPVCQSRHLSSFYDIVDDGLRRSAGTVSPRLRREAELFTRLAACPSTDARGSAADSPDELVAPSW